MACQCGGVYCDCTRSCRCDPCHCRCPECRHLRKGQSTSRSFLAEVHTRSDCTRNCRCDSCHCRCPEYRHLRKGQSTSRGFLAEVHTRSSCKSTEGYIKARSPETSSDELSQDEEVWMFKMDDIDTSPESKRSSQSLTTDENNSRPKLTNPVYLFKSYATYPSSIATPFSSIGVHNTSSLAPSRSTNVPSRESGLTAATTSGVATSPSSTANVPLNREKPSSRGKSSLCSKSSRPEKLKKLFSPNNMPSVHNRSGNLASNLSQSSGSDSAIEVIPEDEDNLAYIPRNVYFPDPSGVASNLKVSPTLFSRVPNLQNPKTPSSGSFAAAYNTDFSRSSSLITFPACSESSLSENLRSSSCREHFGTEPPSSEHSTAKSPTESGNPEERTDNESESD